jgi:hypothetical protein
VAEKRNEAIIKRFLEGEMQKGGSNALFTLCDGKRKWILQAWVPDEKIKSESLFLS